MFRKALEFGAFGRGCCSGICEGGHSLVVITDLGRLDPLLVAKNDMDRESRLACSSCGFSASFGASLRRLLEEGSMARQGKAGFGGKAGN